MSSLTQEQKSRVTIVYHDLKSEINPWIKKEIGEIDIILHLAAGSHVDRSIDYPMEFVLDNIVGTANILEYARSTHKSTGLERFIYFSTDEIFGPAPKGVDYKENDRYNSTNPYSASKAGGEELSVAYENTYGLPVYITHTMNVFGERQHPEKFVPKIINHLIQNKTLTIHSNKNKTRAGSRFYIHAKDVADAVMFILKKGKVGEKYNIVGSKELDNLQLAQIVAKTLKFLSVITISPELGTAYVTAVMML